MDPYIMKKPCGECPFSRKVEPGALGGSEPQTYIGQAHGPFFLPCHQHSDFEDPNWKTDMKKPWCAGAAMFRDAVGVAEKLPEAVHKLKHDPELVFSFDEEFVAHHMQISVERAKFMLDTVGVQRLVIEEFLKAQGRG